MKTLTIEMRWPFLVRVIEGRAYDAQDLAYVLARGRQLQESALVLNPPPLLVAACASKARAESGRRGWQTRKDRQFLTGLAEMLKQDAAKKTEGGEV